MRSFMILLLLVGCGEGSTRQKRFLRTDFLNPLSDSLLGLGDYARDLSDQLSSHASVAVQHVMPQATRALTRLTPWGHRNRDLQQQESRPKKNQMRAPVERETEDEEVELFDPEVSKPHRRPSIGNSFIPFSFSFGFLTPWWEGDNVCEERNEVDEPEQETSQNFTGFSINFETTRCIPSDSSYVCTKKIQTNGMRKTIVVRRQCCHGYVKRTDGRPGCSALKMENVYDTMKSLEMTKFLSWMESAGLKEKLLTDNITVFTPSNEAIVDFEDDSEDNEISAINPAKLTDMAPTVSGHIVEGFLNVDAVEDEQLLDTLNEQAKIRINKYQPAHEVVTANCVPVSGKNHLATNGIVHLTSGVLPLLQSSVADILSSNKEFSRFRKLLEESSLWNELQKDEHPWTLFVPTNAAFLKLPRVLQKQIESGEGCVESILHQHVVKGTVCSAAIISQNRVKNILDNSLMLTKDEEDKLRVDGAAMEQKDMVATNGVIHGIDTVLIPLQARTLLKALEEEERRDLLDLIEMTDLITELEQSKNITFFLPTKEAIKGLSNETREEMLNNPEYLKAVLQHHLVQEHLPSNKFLDNSKLSAASGHTLHMKLHELFPGIVTGATVQCAFVVSHDNQACGAVIHKINKVLVPPAGSIAEVLQDMEGHSIVLKLLKNTDLETKLREEGPFTFLAPTDDAFERMTESSLDELLENNTMAEDILKLHVLPEVLCCNSVPHSSPFHRQFVRTFDGSILPLHRSIGDRVRFGRARANTCDIPATNGLIHSINRVIQRQKPKLFTMDLWPFF